jgi:hypothetical protein
MASTKHQSRGKTFKDTMATTISVLATSFLNGWVVEKEQDKTS